MNSVESPTIPRPTTESPMTRPPENATFRAFDKPSRAACVVLTFALVATFMPKKPASAEQIAPTMKLTEMIGEESTLPLLAKPRRIATEITKMVNTLYSRLRNATAPSAMCPAIVAISSVPESCFETHPALNKAYSNAMTPERGTA